ncbi:ubiquitin-protein ligase E3A isoform X1 [Aphis craccivora]|uniref:HECT-type E3 ubiquitin transferase n=1 Tax=Aphis craccivora TaxID=307492 RepID=A0A6G0Z4T6_APHCR|nr:ubiquitin-protein ligase E3A isoform X1 [Aphis craccivora]
MKRDLAKKLIERYFYLITEGCGNGDCVNDYCASSKRCTNVVSANDAAATAIQLFRLDARLCDQHPMKVARTTNNPSVSGNTLHDANTSLACCSNTQDTLYLSHDACVQTNPCTVFQVNPVHTTDLSRSLSDAQISQTTSTCSQTESGGSSSSFKIVGAEPMTKEHSPFIAPIESMAQQEGTSSQFSKEEVNEDVSKHKDDHANPHEQNNSTNHSTNKDILDRLDVASLEIPECVLHEVEDINLTFMETMKNTIKHIASIQNGIKYLNETNLIELTNQQNGPDPCKDNNELLSALYHVFSTPEALGNSFIKRPQEHKKDFLKVLKHTKNLSTSMTKEKIREMEIEKELDDNSMDEDDEVEGEEVYGEKQLDIEGLARAYNKINSTNNNEFYKNVLCLAISSLCAKITVELHYFKSKSFPISDKYLEDVLHSLKIIYQMPWLDDLSFVERIVPRLVAATCILPVAEQAKLARFWSEMSSENTLRRILHCLQEAITFQLISTEYDATFQDETAVVFATKTMKILYYASIMAGECDTNFDNEDIKQPEKIETKTENVKDEDLLKDILINTRPKKKTSKIDPLAEVLNINILACRAPLIPISKFYNELLSDALEMDDDYQTWREHGNEKFSYMSHSFILTPSTKTLGLYYDNRIRMYENRRFCLIQTLIGQPSHPYLKLKVRREHVVQDALVELEMVAMQNPSDLKKQLAVEFDGEQGVDEGGVSKEFFHLIVEELFNPDYGMFVIMNSESGNPTYWFNSFSFETAAQYSLIGLIVGLAIYNNVILNINLPMVVYRKLLGKRCTFNDLQDWNQELYNGLKNLLDYEEDDIEEMFMQTFRICYKDAFGEIVYHDLIDNGDNVTVNHMNKKEFVNKYADFLLNESIGIQFNAFYRGFQNVMEESPLQYLFWPEELEQIVCGSKVFDMSELEETTLYEGGYHKDTEVIKFFWEFAHALPRASQQKLLQFTTGSDRVPVGGLGKLKLTITRNGSDSDRLPTAHTCFNILLLPEYSSKDKLDERLSKAINYAEGFGMI